jgi:putative colanic acid biosynthesis acetyltransferase WcaB
MTIFQDWASNRGNTKGRIILVLFRLAGVIRGNAFLRIILFFYLPFYRLIVEWTLGIELPYTIKAGHSLKLFHGQALVVHEKVTIGNFCTLRQSTTIGNKQLANNAYSNCPVLGDHVDVGANVCIIGDITIGDHVVIGAGSVVTKNVPSGAIVVGNPARVLGVREKNE